jgi:four helix bundle protein
MSGRYQDLCAWQKAMDMVVEVYRQTQDFPKPEIYGIVAQMRRAAVSVASNIAEGKGRSSDKDFVLFLTHARGSVLELETQITIAARLGYLQAERSTVLTGMTAEVGKVLNGLINSLRESIQTAREKAMAG